MDAITFSPKASMLWRRGGTNGKVIDAIIILYEISTIYTGVLQGPFGKAQASWVSGTGVWVLDVFDAAKRKSGLTSKSVDEIIYRLFNSYRRVRGGD